MSNYTSLHAAHVAKPPAQNLALQEDCRLLYRKSQTSCCPHRTQLRKTASCLQLPEPHLGGHLGVFYKRPTPPLCQKETQNRMKTSDGLSILSETETQSCSEDEKMFSTQGSCVVLQAADNITTKIIVVAFAIPNVIMTSTMTSKSVSYELTSSCT